VLVAGPAAACEKTLASRPGRTQQRGERLFSTFIRVPDPSFWLFIARERKKRTDTSKPLSAHVSMRFDQARGLGVISDGQTARRTEGDPEPSSGHGPIARRRRAGTRRRRRPSPLGGIVEQRRIQRTTEKKRSVGSTGAERQEDRRDSDGDRAGRRGTGSVTPRARGANRGSASSYAAPPRRPTRRTSPGSIHAASSAPIAFGLLSRDGP